MSCALPGRRPRPPTVGSTGIGSDDHLAMLLLERPAGVKLTHVPFPCSAENYRALVGCHTGSTTGIWARDRTVRPTSIRCGCSG